MRNYLYIFIYLSTILSCSNPTNINLNIVDSTKVKKQIISIDTNNNKIKDNSNLTNTLTIIQNVKSLNSIETPINTNFPFGSSALLKYKYPMYWKGNEEGLLMPKGKQYEVIDNYYREINNVQTLGLMNVNTLEVININSDFINDFYFDSSALKLTDSCKYHLPNIGIYECYYFFQNVSRKSNDGSYGNLLLFDPLTKNGKILNIYFNYSGDQNVNYRYFFLDKNQLSIYDGSCYDNGCDLCKSYSIIINPDGKVNVIPIKQKQ